MTRPTLKIDKEYLNKKRLLKVSQRTPREANAIRKDQIKKITLFLNQQFPTVFNLKDPKPLKLGILRDLVKITSIHGFSASNTRKAIYKWCKRYSYQLALTTHENRYCVNGDVFEQVSEEHKQHAEQIVLTTGKSRKKRKRA